MKNRTLFKTLSSIWYLLIAIITIAAPVASIAANLESTNSVVQMYVGQANKLTFDSRVNTVFIADPKVASFQAPNASTILLFARQPGSTSLYVLDDEGNDIFSANVEVGYDLSELQPTLTREFPNSNIIAKPYGNTVMLTGYVPSPSIANQAVGMANAILNSKLLKSASGNAESSGAVSSDSAGGESGAGSVGQGRGISGLEMGQVVNRLTVLAPTQVNIRVRIAEVSKQVKENFGFQWNYAGESVKDALNSVTFGFTKKINWASGNSIVGDFGSTGADAVGMVDILASENLVSVLAEPNLTATSGETASFLAGGEVPQVIGGNDEQAATVEYKPFGVLLSVTPTVMSQNRIALKVKTEISDVSAANAVGQYKGFSVRRAETSVELASGQSFALAGLVKRDVTDELENLPWVNQLPVLGRLFESSKFKNNETELVIIATAYLVDPASSPLDLPTDRVHLASPFERLVFGRSLKPLEDYQRPPKSIADEAFLGFEF